MIAGASRRAIRGGQKKAGLEWSPFMISAVFGHPFRLGDVPITSPGSGDRLMSIHATEETLPKPKWLNIEQLMQILPLKKSRIYYLTHIGGIPHHKIGQTLLFREDEILEWMQGKKVA
jgi:excisionase family DNA binding protein